MCDEPARHFSHLSVVPTLFFSPIPPDLVSWFLSVFLRRSTLSNTPSPLLFVLFFFDEPAQLPIDWPVDGLSVIAGFYSEHPDSVNYAKPKAPLPLDQGTTLMSTQTVL